MQRESDDSQKSIERSKWLALKEIKEKEKKRTKYVYHKTLKFDLLRLSRIFPIFKFLHINLESRINGEQSREDRIETKRGNDLEMSSRQCSKHAERKKEGLVVVDRSRWKKGPEIGRRFHTKGTKAQIWPRLWWPSRKNFTTWSGT